MVRTFRRLKQETQQLETRAKQWIWASLDLQLDLASRKRGPARWFIEYKHLPRPEDLHLTPGNQFPQTVLWPLCMCPLFPMCLPRQRIFTHQFRIISQTNQTGFWGPKEPNAQDQEQTIRKARCVRDGSVAKRICYSCRGGGFNSQQPHWAAHNYL